MHQRIYVEGRAGKDFAPAFEQFLDNFTAGFVFQPDCPFNRLAADTG